MGGEPPFGIAPPAGRSALSGRRRAGRGGRGGGDDAGDLSPGSGGPEGLPRRHLSPCRPADLDLLGARPRAADRGGRRGVVQLVPHRPDGSLSRRRQPELGGARGLPGRSGDRVDRGRGRARPGDRGAAAPGGGRSGGRDGAHAARRRQRRRRAAARVPAARRSARPALRVDRDRGVAEHDRESMSIPLHVGAAGSAALLVPGGPRRGRAAAADGPRRALAGGAAGRRAGPRAPAARGGRDPGAAALGRPEDRAAACRLPRPPHAAHHDHGRR